MGEPATPGGDRRARRRERLTRARRFVTARSGVERFSVALVLLLAVSAPFGGLRSATVAEAVPLELGQRLDIGPFDVTITKVSQVGDLEPAVSPEDDGSRLLVLSVTVTNDTDEPQPSYLAVDAFGGTGVGLRPWTSQAEPDRPRVFDIDDAGEVPGTEYVNPGVTYHWALVLQQDPATDLDRLRLSVLGYYFREEDPQTLEPDTWRPQQGVMAEGHVDVVVQP